MNITNEAVDAALEAFYANCDLDFDCLRPVKAALAAAAPHMRGRAITTEAGLESLKSGTVVLGNDGLVWLSCYFDVELPATVLHEPAP